MDLVLTARMMDAAEAERAGLVSRVVAVERVLDEAIEAATIIASMSLPSVMMAKECINRAYEAPLNEGLLFERRHFHALFATHDQKEGIRAFVEKRNPDFKHRGMRRLPGRAIVVNPRHSFFVCHSLTLHIVV